MTRSRFCRPTHRTAMEALESRTLLSTTAASADAFVDSFGVNPTYPDYTSNTNMDDYASYGFRHIRGDGGSSNPTYVNAMNYAYNTYGLKATLLTYDGESGATTVSKAKQFPTAMLDGIEGPNEVDMTPGTQQSKEAAQQADVYSSVHNDSTLRNVPVIMMSTNVSQYQGYKSNNADVLNMHSYPDTAQGVYSPTKGLYGGDSAGEYASLAYNISIAQGSYSASNKPPVVATETGYSNANVDRGTQAKYDPMILAEYFRAGVQRTYLFNFYDNGEHFDIYNQPAGYAIKNMSSILSDSSWNASTHSRSTPNFAPGALDFSLSGNTANVRTLLLQKQNGDYYLLLWQAVSDYNKSTGTPINNPTAGVTLNLASSIDPGGAAAWTLDPSNGNYNYSTLGVSGAYGSQSVSLNVPDSVMIVKLSPTAPINHAVALRAVNNLYVSDDHGTAAEYLRAGFASGVGSWERFDVVDAGGGNIALKSEISGKYVSADLNDSTKLKASFATSIGSWEKFQWVNLGGGNIGLKSTQTGKFVTSDQNAGAGGQLRADWAGSAGSWETFGWNDLGALPTGPAPGTTLFSDNFESGNANNWAVQSGTWSVNQPAGHSYEYAGSNGIATAGSASWANYSVSATVLNNSDTTGAAILGRVQDANHFYQLELKNVNGNKEVDIWKDDGGTWTQLGRWNFAWTSGNYYNLRMTFSGSTITASWQNGSAWSDFGSVTDSTWSTGYIGLRTDGSARFDNLSVVAV